ncbi:hypothetical protein [Brachybacterium sp. ACRRE]|uniref:hypothetical protein n=1 Tax=Brachybacterium sp. ACRRE TaxID=2918184 RepID=UPI001EF21C0A|nr:hypothetical protein [Brachybacterium sp. ACRRE]MCG7309660.1 hypothetical protein [Brachybacterium sp. ACRRE]
MWRLLRGKKRTEEQGSAPGAPDEATSSGEDTGPAASTARTGAANRRGRSAASGASAASAASANASDGGEGFAFSVDHRLDPAGADIAPLQDEDALPRRRVDDRPLSRADRVGSALDRWILQIAGTRAEPSFLTRMRAGEHVLDLTHSHPSGLAQLLAGRGPTRLSSLVREVGALADARAEARAIREIAERQAEEVGLSTCHLGIGEATWIPEEGGEPYHAPVLVRPITLRLRGSAREDVDLDLDATVDVNPILLRALREAGIAVDARALLATTEGPYGFDPTPVIDAFKSLGQPLPGFRVAQALVVGNLMDAAGQLVDDLRTDAADWADSDLVAALAGDPEARTALAPSADGPASPGSPSADRPAPGGTRGTAGESAHEPSAPAESEMVTSLPPDRMRVLAQVLAGGHLAVSTPPGTDPIDLVVDLAAEANARGRSVLVVSQRRANLAHIAALARERGLEDLVFDLSPDPSLQRNASAALLQSLRRAGSFSSPVSTAEPEELAEARSILTGHVEAMHRVQQPWNASAHDALSALAALTRMRPAPRTEVRLGADVAATMVGEDRERGAESLREAARLGVLSIGPEDTAWYGAPITTDTQAERALALVERLREKQLPQLRRAIERTGGEIGLAPARTLEALIARLQLLSKVRGALSVFQGAVFAAPLDDLIAATATKDWRREHGVVMSFTTRRRLRKEAAALQRPASLAPDLHEALRTVRAVREEWRAADGGSGAAPSVPEKLENCAQSAESMQALCDELAVLLEGTPAGGALARTDVDDLAERADALFADRDDLAELPRRTTLLRSLAADGLGDLVEDLRARGVREKHVAAELDLAWWQSVLELIARAEPTISQYDGTGLSQVAERFRRLDAQHMERASYRVRGASDDRLVSTMMSFPDTSRAAIAELARSSTVSVRDLAAKYEDILFAARPTWLASPYLVPQVVPRGRHVDMVIVADGGRLPTAAALPAIARADQVVVLGDVLDHAEVEGPVLLDDMLQVAPHIALHRDPRPAGSVLRAFAQRRSLVGEVVSTPSPSAPDPDRLVVVENGRGAVPTGTELVESTEAELRRVTDLVIEHARHRPELSLAVFTLTAEHARKVMERIMHTVSVVPGLREFFDAASREYFTVLPASRASGVVRDEVIVSLGFGKTPHGRLLHRFGPLSAPDGRKALATVLTRSRGRTTVVSAFDVEDLDPSRLKSEGARDLRAMLTVLHGGADADLEAPDAAGTPAAEAPAPASTSPASASSAASASSPASPAEETESSVDAQIEAALAAADAQDESVAPDDGATDADVDDADADAAAATPSETDGASDEEPAQSSEVQAAEASADADSTAAAASGDESGVTDEKADGKVADVRDAASQDAASQHAAASDAGAPHDAAQDDSAQDDSTKEDAAQDGSWQDEPSQDEPVAHVLETNALVNDLADRLWRLGLVVDTDFGVTSDRIDLALGHPDLPGRYLLAVDTDGERYVATASQRERDRLRAERLEASGWATERVWSWALFIDPDGEAERIRRGVERALMLYREEAEQAALEGAGGARHRLPRPQIPAGHPLEFYASEDFDSVVEYIASDGRARLEDHLAAEVRSFLGFTQRSVLLDVSVSSAIRRFQERQ